MSVRVCSEFMVERVSERVEEVFWVVFCFVEGWGEKYALFFLPFSRGLVYSRYSTGCAY